MVQIISIPHHSLYYFLDYLNLDVFNCVLVWLCVGASLGAQCNQMILHCFFQCSDGAMFNIHADQACHPLFSSFIPHTHTLYP
jgi:hypothetical protein